MRKAILLILIMVFSIVGISGCIDGADKSIGGETDEHGCLPTAGYTWCETKQKCLRIWEENCPPDYADDAQGRAIEIAEEYAKNMKSYTDETGRDLKINSVVQFKCPGCWIIYLQYDLNLGKPTDIYTNDRMTVNITLSNWKVSDAVSGRGGVIVLTPEECIAKGARTVNIVGGDTCDINEINIGDVKGFISPNICCMPLEEPMTIADAIEIAENSECTEKGALTDSYMHNENTNTWWIDLDMKEEFEQEYCNPACVVNENTKTAEINWRCMGALPPE